MLKEWSFETTDIEIINKTPCIARFQSCPISIAGREASELPFSRIIKSADSVTETQTSPSTNAFY